jgi:hypothetical protein
MRLNEFRTPVFEINFNDPKLAKSILSASIQCGFEAESVWDVEPSIEYDSDYLADVDWDDSIVQDNIPSRTHNRVEQAFYDWIRETQVVDYLSDAQEWWVEANRDNYYDEFIDSENLEDEFEEWSKENDNSDKEEFISDNYADRYYEWLNENANEYDDGEIYDRAYEKAIDDYSIDDWARQEYGSVYRMLAVEFSEYLDDYLDAGGGLEAVSAEIESWAIENSKFNEVVWGGYHSSGRRSYQWGVEEDGSIDPPSVTTGAEIISPVYNTPNEMLEEMKSLFKFFTSKGVETTKKTGLHVTMSWPEIDAGEVNKLKMALLLGDQYLLKQFGREEGTDGYQWTKSQLAAIQNYSKALTKDINDANSLEKLENLLNKGIRSEKYSAINFKSLRNDYGNQLIEFRIAGNEGYHLMVEKATKAVVRYATVMRAGYTDEYHKDYIRALMRLVASSKKLNPDVVADVEIDNEDIKQKPIMAVVQNFISNDHYRGAVANLARAYTYLAQSQTGQKELFEDGEDGEEIRDWQQTLRLAQEHFVKFIVLMAIDLLSGTNRSSVNSQVIRSLRVAMREFKLDTDTIAVLIKESSPYKAWQRDNDNKEQLDNAINQLFKAEIVKPTPPVFTIEYNPNSETVLLLESVYDLIDSANPPERLTVNMFKIVNKQEYNSVYITQHVLKRKEIELARAKTNLIRAPKLGEFGVAEIREIEQTIRDLEEKISSFTKETSAFKQKYGFLPSGDKFSSEGAEGLLYQELSPRAMQQIGKQYNIAFVPK